MAFSLNIDSILLAGTTLWALALYLGFSPLNQKLMEWLSQSFSANPYQDLWASVLSIIPFLGVGLACAYALELSLGRSWSISMGIIACMGCGVYELGRQQGQ
jgi:uncharacterized membrane protein